MLASVLFAASAASHSTPGTCDPLDYVPPLTEISAGATAAPNAYGLKAIEPLETVGKEELQRIASRFPGEIEVSNGARLFRIVYQTRLRGKRVKASGLLALPITDEPLKGTFVYLHGTNADRATAPSQPERVDGNEETAIFAGNGYAVILPDYIGLGVSRLPQAYLLTKPQVDASIDMLLAARSAQEKIGCKWEPSLYMMGFSQGGQVVAGLHRELETDPIRGFEVAGSVGIAGPYDLRKTSVSKAREHDCLICVGYLAWAADSAARHYGYDLADAIQPDYVELVPRLFDGSLTEMEIASQLPSDPAELFEPVFLAQLRKDEDNWLLRSFDANETFQWAPKAPFRIHVGEADQDVVPEAAYPFFAFATAHGGNVTLQSMSELDHMESAAHSYAIALQWFEQLRAAEDQASR